MALAIARQPSVDLTNPAHSLVGLKNALSMAAGLGAVDAMNLLVTQVHNTIASCEPAQKLKAVTSTITPLLKHLEDLRTKYPQLRTGVDRLSAAYGLLLNLVMESWIISPVRSMYSYGTQDYQLNDSTAEMFVKLLPRLGGIEVVQTR